MKRFVAFLTAAFLSHAGVHAAGVVQLSYDYSTTDVVYALTDKGVALPVTGTGTYPPTGLPAFVKVESSNGSALGLTAAGAVVSWDSLAIPPEVQSGVIDVASASESYYGDLNWALKSNGTVVHWGNNRTTETFSRPNLKSITFCRNNFAVGLKTDGTVIRLRPNTPLSISNVKKIGCGNYKMWFLLNDGQVAMLNDLNQIVYANSQANGDAIDIGVTISHLFVLKSNGSVVMANASDGALITQPPARLTRNVKALTGQYALRKDGTIVSLYDETTIRSHFKREKHDLDGARIDQTLWKAANSYTLHSAKFRGRGLGFDFANIGFLGASDWQVVGKGRFFDPSYGRTGYIGKNPIDGNHYYSLKTYGTLTPSQYNSSWQMGVFGNTVKIELTGDLNGDGIDEIVWRNTQTGNAEIGFYHTNPATYRKIGNFASNVKFEGISDFDNNGYGDILFRNTSTGNTVIGLFDASIMTTSPIITWKTISNIQGYLNIVGIDDFNMDGIDDILVQNPVSGRVMVGRMTRNLNNPINWTDVITVAPPVQLWNVGDYDGDGFKDILWRNPNSGNVAVTYIENYLAVGTYTEGNIPTSYTPIK